jgi:hypothetical protein
MTMNPRSPWLIVAGALLLASAYTPTLSAPFDFIDDGNLVYPSETTTLAGHAELWWDKVKANYDHLGPFRPTLWVHWQVAAHTLGGDAGAWRAVRWVWCALAAGMLLWLFRELGMHPVAGLAAGALAMWNPYRNEVWVSLTLAEGVAMPYALLALVAARKAADARRPLWWDTVSVVSVLVALGCKNTFAALVPAQMALRLWPDSLGLKEAIRKNKWRAAALGATLAMPVAHFVYFKANWHPGQYETHGPSLAQLARVAVCLKGAMSLDFMAAGLILALVAARKGVAPARPALLCAVPLLLGGVVVYLPMDMISGRYAMPAVWGLDVLFALLMTAVISAPPSLWRRAALVGVGAGLAVVLVASVGRQERVKARAHMLWQALHHIEATAPPDTRIGWLSGDSIRGGLNVEEGIHFQWHLRHRGRPDIQVGLFDENGKPLSRVEVSPLDGPPQVFIGGKVPDPQHTFSARYYLGRREYACQVGAAK